MNTWVLVIILYGGFKSTGSEMNMAAVPGYTSEAACNAAGDYFMHGRNGVGRYQCIPGPEAEKK